MNAHIHAHEYTYIHTHEYTHVHMNTHRYTWTYTCAHEYTYLHMNTHTQKEGEGGIVQFVDSMWSSAEHFNDTPQGSSCTLNLFSVILASSPLLMLFSVTGHEASLYGQTGQDVILLVHPDRIKTLIQLLSCSLALSYVSATRDNSAPVMFGNSLPKSSSMTQQAKPSTSARSN